MSVPKLKGYRSIVVMGLRFKWRCVDHIVVVPDGLSWRQVLNVDFGWVDPWLYVGHPEDRPPDSTSATATPAFVAAAILFALK